jgi:carboxyl-terminal processing protease
MLDPLLPEGTIVYMEDKNGARTDYDSDKECIDIPMAVLINGNSASASEIFAGAVRDYGVATLVGTKTFGKGIAQSIIPLGDGSAIKLTIEQYFIPSGVCIHEVGIEPDVKVELSDEARENYSFENDNQIETGIDEVIKQIESER